MDQVVSFNFTSSNQAFNGLWSYDYEGISRANLAISYLTDRRDHWRKSAIDAGIEIQAARRSLFPESVLLLRSRQQLRRRAAVAEAAQELRRSVRSRQERSESDGLHADQRRPCPGEDAAAGQQVFRCQPRSGEPRRERRIAMQAKVALYNQKWTEVISSCRLSWRQPAITA